MDENMLKGLFDGANLNGAQINVLTGDHAEVSYNKNGGSRQAQPTMDEQQAATVEKLKPIFFGIEQEAREFLIAIQGMKPIQVTEQVNRLVTDGKISELSRKRVLYSILHDANLYEPSEQNWCSQVK
jgi:hypothetical protein